MMKLINLSILRKLYAIQEEELQRITGLNGSGLADRDITLKAIADRYGIDNSMMYEDNIADRLGIPRKEFASIVNSVGVVASTLKTVDNKPVRRRIPLETFRLIVPELTRLKYIQESVSCTELATANAMEPTGIRRLLSQTAVVARFRPGCGAGEVWFDARQARAAIDAQRAPKRISEAALRERTESVAGLLERCRLVSGRELHRVASRECGRSVSLIHRVTPSEYDKIKKETEKLNKERENRRIK